MGVPWWLRHKEYTCNAGDLGSVSGLGRSSGEGIGNPLQYSCLAYIYIVLDSRDDLKSVK